MLVSAKECECDRCGRTAQMDIDDQGEHVGGTVRTYPEGWEGLDEAVLCPDCSPTLLQAEIEQLQQEVSDLTDYQIDENRLLTVEIYTRFDQTIARFMYQGKAMAAQFTSKEWADKLKEIESVQVEDKR